MTIELTKNDGTVIKFHEIDHAEKAIERHGRNNIAKIVLRFENGDTVQTPIDEFSKLARAFSILKK